MRLPEPAPGLHHSWLGYTEHVPADEPQVIVQRRSVTHCLIHLQSGRAAVRSVWRGREQWISATAGTIYFCPADGEVHTLIGRHNPAHDVFTLLIPPSSLDALATTDVVATPFEPRSLVSFRDAELERYVSLLALPAPTDGDAEPRRQEAARRLVLRIVHLLGGHRPDRHDDNGVLDAVTLGHLVAMIESRLRIPPTLEEMAALVGLSPSHFAVKFRLTTGMSLHRFAVQKRVQAAFPLLQAGDMPLASVALELGFTSQSHFTNLFSQLTGMTPAKFRKQFRRKVVGRPRGPPADPRWP